MSLCGDPEYEKAIDIEKERAEAAAENLEGSLLYSERQRILKDQPNYLEMTLAQKNKELRSLDIYGRSVNFSQAAEKNFPKDTENLDVEQLKEIEEIEQRTEAAQLAALTPTVASILKEPDYQNTTVIPPTNDFRKIISTYNLMKGYAAIRVNFYFPASVKFPPIPVSLKMKSSNQTIYPLSGQSLITGPEFLAAANILLSLENPNAGLLKVVSGTYIPFKQDLELKNEIIPAYSPFAPVIKELQANRAKWKKLTGKKSAMERIYKDLGNMLYGKVVSGLSNKVSFDSRLITMKNLASGQLTNPIIGC